jgi:hypothetical protein
MSGIDSDGETRVSGVGGCAFQRCCLEGGEVRSRGRASSERAPGA